MIKNYFNTPEFTRILNLIKSDPSEAKNRLEKYLKEYPDDYWAYSVYASVLIILQDFYSANIVIENINLKLEASRFFSHDTRKKDAIKRRLFFSKVRLLSYTKKYQELYEFLLENKKIASSFHLEELKLYCQKKLGILPEQNRAEKLYLVRQIIRYDKYDMLNRLRYHTFDYNDSIETPNDKVFAKEFPLGKVLKEVRKNIPSEKKLCFGILDDTYYFKYDNCGTENNVMTDFIKVTCFQDTSDILTMEPVLNASEMPYVDLNYLKDNGTNNKEKVKKENQ